MLAQYPILLWVVDQDQLNPYVAYEGYVVRVPHNPQLAVTCEKFSESRRYIHLIEKGYSARIGLYSSMISPHIRLISLECVRS